MLGDESMRLPLPWQLQAWASLQQRRRDDRLPHALLFTGPAGTGKSAFAAHLARSLACPAVDAEGQPCGHCHDCQTSLAGSHPDVQHIEPEEPGKAIKVDAIRELIRRSVLTSEGGGYRVFVIEPADALNAAAANALLKTLEEPVPGTLFILLTARPDRLPATIRSRCQNVSFPVPAVPLLESWMEDRLPAREAGDIAAWCGHAPLVMLETAADDGLQEARELLDQLTKLKQRQANPLQVAARWRDAQPERVLDGLGKILADMSRVAGAPGASARYLPGSQQGLQTLVEGIDLKDIHRFTDKLFALRRGLSRNFNMGMLLQDIVVDWLAMTRRAGR